MDTATLTITAFVVILAIVITSVPVTELTTRRLWVRAIANYLLAGVLFFFIVSIGVDEDPVSCLILVVSAIFWVIAGQSIRREIASRKEKNNRRG